VEVFPGTDAQPGAPGGRYAGPHVVVAGTATLAGAIVPLDGCARNLQACTGWDAAAVLECVTRRPARLLGLAGVVGDLLPGCMGDVVLLNDALVVQATYIGGVRAY
jgi:N-acetylglucosamine-6-phosphate deacetylase